MKSLKQKSAMKVLLVVGGLMLGLGATYAFSQMNSKLTDKRTIGGQTIGGQVSIIHRNNRGRVQI